ncbi:MAG: hypothetical protein H8E37_09635, partial [Planctomycetes bacterium]|nr:hypothetical protein [Planctomycetota bacterium]
MHNIATRLCLLAAGLSVWLTEFTFAADQKPGTQIATKLTVAVEHDGEKKDVEVRYLQFLPENYTSDGKALPLILFLHGSGERGTNIDLVKKWGPPRIVEKKKELPFIVISPQCPSGRGWDTQELLTLVEHTLKTLNADSNRVAMLKGLFTALTLTVSVTG